MRENAVYRYLARFGQAVSETVRSFLNGPTIDISHSPVPARRAVAPCQILGARLTTLESPLLVPAAELGGALELAAASVKE
jgi:hypothetical protein